MEMRREIILVLAMAAMLTVAALPCHAAQKDEKDEKNIWTEDESPAPRRGPRRFELTEEEIGRIMEGLKKRDPEKAKELAGLREKEPEKFNAELRRHAQEEFGKVIRERIEKWREQRRNDFLEWLQKIVPSEAKELAELKSKNPDLYAKKYELASNKYDRLFNESRRHPELVDVIKEDLELKKRREELRAKIKAAKNEKQRKKLVEELEEVVGNRYDLLVRRKQIAYEQLLKWLEELKNRIMESRAEIGRLRDDKVKAENVKKRTQELIEGKKEGIDWD